jgi:hypothetical protein
MEAGIQRLLPGRGFVNGFKLILTLSGLVMEDFGNLRLQTASYPVFGISAILAYIQSRDDRSMPVMSR